MQLTTLITHSAIALSLMVLSGCQESSSSSEPTSIDATNIRVLNRFNLYYDENTEVAVREHNYAPGWTAPTHFHNSDLFIYIINGEFEVTMKHTGKVVYTTGQAMRMEPETVMDARNPSDDNPLKLVVFQVGALDEPFVVPVK